MPMQHTLPTPRQLDRDAAVLLHQALDCLPFVLILITLVCFGCWALVWQYVQAVGALVAHQAAQPLLSLLPRGLVAGVGLQNLYFL